MSNPLTMKSWSPYVVGVLRFEARGDLRGEWDADRFWKQGGPHAATQSNTLPCSHSLGQVTGPLTLKLRAPECQSCSTREWRTAAPGRCRVRAAGGTADVAT